MGFGTHADFHPGELLGTHFLNDGLDAVVTAGRAVGPDPEPSRLQGNVVKQNDDSLRGNVKISGKLQHAAPRKIHIGLGLQQKQLAALIIGLAVQTLIFQLIYFYIQFLCDFVQTAEACIVAGLFIFATGISQSHNQPAFTGIFLKHNQSPNRPYLLIL